MKEFSPYSSNHKSKHIDIHILNWNNLPASKVWSLQYFLGRVRLDATHPSLFQWNKYLILHNQYPDFFTPGDEFLNFGALQIFNLHPCPKGNGVVGNKLACSIYWGAGNRYNNSIWRTDNKLYLNYIWPKKTENELLKQAYKNQSKIRVFIGSNASVRQQISSCYKNSVVYLMDGKILECKQNFGKYEYLLKGKIPHCLKLLSNDKIM